MEFKENKTVDISIIIPVYNANSAILKALLDNIITIFENRYSFEILCVDDGSKETNYNAIREITKNYKIIRWLRSQENKGQNKVLLEGIKYASGDIIATIDQDFEYNPSDIIKLLKIIEQGCDVVSGWRKERDWDSYLRKIGARFINCIISRITDKKINDLTSPLKVFRKETAIPIINNKILSLFPLEFTLCSSNNFKEIEIYYKKGTNSNYSFLRLVKEFLLLIFTIVYFRVYANGKN
jgi:glycosyltransferase involved in cell wall biosynthesis